MLDIYNQLILIHENNFILLHPSYQINSNHKVQC